MIAFIDTAQHLAWVLAFIGVVTAIALVLDRTIGRPSIQRHVGTALDLPSPDASDEEFEAWALQAIRLANSAAFEVSVLADIDALANGDVA